jgi:hypothetical protein
MISPFPACWARVAVVSLGGALVVALGVVLAPTVPAQAQHGPCLPSIPVDAARDARLGTKISVDAKVVRLEEDAPVGTRAVDEVQVTWERAPSEDGAKCIWVGIDDFNTAILLLPGDATSFSWRPVGSSGEQRDVCFRLIPVSEAGVGQTTEVCVFVERFTGPRDTAVGGTPGAPSAGTGLISDDGSGAWVVGFLVVTGTIVLVLVVSGRLRRRAG